MGYQQFGLKKPTIEITQAIIDTLLEIHIARVGEDRANAPGVKDQLIENFIGREILYREALKRDLNQKDAEIRERMIMSMQYLLAGQIETPNENILKAYYNAHLENYISDAKISFDHYFYLKNPSSEGENILATLNQDQPLEGTDEFWLGNRLIRYEEPVLRQILGDDFSKIVFDVDLNTWIGPVQSNRGFHFLKVDARQALRQLSFGFVSDRVREDWHEDQQRQKMGQELARLKKTYTIILPDQN